jgi:hypothetical protein
VETEKQPLLANGSETTFASRQRLHKHVPAATDTPATVEVLLKIVFSTRSVQRDCKENNWGNKISSELEAVKRGTGRVELKYLHCSKPLSGNG